MKKALRAIRLLVASAFRADPWRATATFLAQPISWAGSAFIAYFLKLLTDGAFRSDFREASIGALGIAGSIAVVYLMGTLTARMNVHLQDRTSLYIDQELMRLSSELPHLEHHERPEYIDQMELLREGRARLAGVIGNIVYALSVLGQVLVIVVLLASLHPVLLLLPVFAVPSFLAGTAGTRLFKRIDEENAEKVRLGRHLFKLTTTAGPAKEVRVFRLADDLLDRHRRIWEDVYQSRIRASKKSAVWAALGWSVFTLGYVAAIGFVAFRAFEGQATPGDVLLAIFLGNQVNGAVSGLIGNLTSLYWQMTLADRYLWLLDYAHQIRSELASRESTSRDVPASLSKGVELKDLSFSYPGTDTEVLHDINLFLPAGSTVALVGENGAGKTTLVKLLSGFYEPTEGEILVDGADLRRFDLEDWRSRVSAGFQDFSRFEFLTRETVGVGDLPFLEDTRAVSLALARAGSSEIVDGLPDGLETQLGPIFGGVELSGGQWQKLALGRAMMREEPLLLTLDEPTASLDAPTEHALFERFASAVREGGGRGAVTVLVSHRFSTVRMADLIVVVDGGKIIEQGSHHELLALGGLYAELFHLQARAYR